MGYHQPRQVSQRHAITGLVENQRTNLLGSSVCALATATSPLMTPLSPKYYPWTTRCGRQGYTQPCHCADSQLTAYQSPPNQAQAPSDLRTPCETPVGPMARECQIFQVVGRLVRHVFDPSSDVSFQKAEALQLERTLKAFLPIVTMEEERHAFYCAAFAICTR